MNRAAPNRSTTRRRILPTSPFARDDAPPPTTDGLSVGGRVTHDRYGLGRIVSVDDQFVTVDFGTDRLVRLRAGGSAWQSL